METLRDGRQIKDGLGLPDKVAQNRGDTEVARAVVSAGK